jgi:hypothetical protein
MERRHLPPTREARGDTPERPVRPCPILSGLSGFSAFVRWNLLGSMNQAAESLSILKSVL